MNKSVFYFICMLVMMAVIFLFSAENFDNTMKTSDVIVKPIETRMKATSDKTFKSEKAEADYWKKIEDKLDKAVRKSAHGINFAVLGIFSVLFFCSIGFRWEDAIMAAIALCFVYACSDELHQKLIKGRDCRIEDICIDTFGAWIGVTLVYLYNKIRRFKMRKA